MEKPVQVYILLGQSNMLGFGKVSGDKEGSLQHAVQVKKKYSYLYEKGKWTVSKKTRNVRVMDGKGGKMQVFHNEWMTIAGSAMIGPEFGIEHFVREADDRPILILKSCIGNRSLGWDLLPPGSKRYEYEGRIYAGYKDSPASWPKGTCPEPIAWYAGKQYDHDVTNAKTVLSDLETYYPGATDYKIAGFFWWQGAKDLGCAAHVSRYEQNLVQLIHQLRRDFDAPHAKFVCATLGQTKTGAKGLQGQLLEAQLAVDGTKGTYKEFQGNVASVYAHPFCHGGGANGHYNRHAETFMDVGEAMGKAMADLLKQERR